MMMTVLAQARVDRYPYPLMMVSDKESKAKGLKRHGGGGFIKYTHSTTTKLKSLNGKSLEVAVPFISSSPRLYFVVFNTRTSFHHQRSTAFPLTLYFPFGV
jgi:hypothetical protein